MASDLTLMLENRPGALAALGEATAAAGVNIEAVCGVTGPERETAVHVLVEDAPAAREALAAAGLAVTSEREVLVVECQDRPGELARIGRALADGGVNVELVYLATATRLVIGTADLDEARGVLAQAS